MEMTTVLSDHLSNLKAVLTDLDATGQEGFEGLIGTALSEIAGVPFRLARSGSQFGVDGKSAYDGTGISFECKRYASQVRTPDVMSKIGELSIGETDIDLWVLCATSSLSSQIVDNVSKFSERSPISTVILDWTDNGLPPLAVALAMASEKVGDFLRKCGVSVESTVKAMAALGTVQNDPVFERQADRIRVTLRDPTLGMDVARQANPCGCSGSASETSCRIESGSGQISARRSCSDKRFQRNIFSVRGDPSSLGQPNDGRGAVNHAPSPVRRAPALGREPVQCSGSVRSIM